MTIAFILAKFTELILKLCIIIFFCISTLIFLYHITAGIDFQKVELCVDMDIGGWNYEERLCELCLYD